MTGDAEKKHYIKTALTDRFLFICTFPRKCVAESFKENTK